MCLCRGCPMATTVSVCKERPGVGAWAMACAGVGRTARVWMLPTRRKRAPHAGLPVGAEVVGKHTTAQMYHDRAATPKAPRCPHFR